MSLTASDLLSLPYDESLTLAGVTYVLQTIHHLGFRDRLPFVSGLRRVAQATATELAVRRWLHSERVPYGLLASEPITEPPRRHMVIGGRRLFVASHTVTSARQIQQLRRDPASLCRAQALIPEMHFIHERFGQGDICLFAYLLCRETRTPSEVQQALRAHMDTHLLALPRKRGWRQHHPWRALGPLTIANPTSQALTIELAGELSDRRLWRKSLSLRPGKTRNLPVALHTLLYLHSLNPATPTLHISSNVLARPWIITSSDWDNVWFYGSQIWLAGWMTSGEFRRHSKHMSAGSRTRLSGRIRSDHRWLRASDLRPLKELLARFHPS
ncbi:MAG: hypothetical protein PVJ07_07505 [Anaerolineales bacterium]|jgi:hypothetical protein